MLPVLCYAALTLMPGDFHTYRFNLCVRNVKRAGRGKARAGIDRGVLMMTSWRAFGADTDDVDDDEADDDDGLLSN